MQRRLRRRQFLELGLTATVAGTAASCSSASRAPGRWRFFTAAEGYTVEAICEQIIPGDQNPGAAQAGVVNYIDLQLTRHFKPHRDAYRKGIATVESASRARFGRRFADLAFAQQTQVLTEIEKDARPFFDLILAHTMQGFYGDPRHGGNRDALSWKMLGVPFPPVRGRARFGRTAG